MWEYLKPHWDEQALLMKPQYNSFEFLLKLAMWLLFVLFMSNLVQHQWQKDWPHLHHRGGVDVSWPEISHLPPALDKVYPQPKICFVLEFLIISMRTLFSDIISFVGIFFENNLRVLRKNVFTVQHQFSNHEDSQVQLNSISMPAPLLPFPPKK